MRRWTFSAPRVLAQRAAHITRKRSQTEMDVPYVLVVPITVSESSRAKLALEVIVGMMFGRVEFQRHAGFALVRAIFTLEHATIFSRIMYHPHVCEER